MKALYTFSELQVLKAERFQELGGEAYTALPRRCRQLGVPPGARVPPPHGDTLHPIKPPEAHVPRRVVGHFSVSFSDERLLYVRGVARLDPEQ